MVAIMGTSTCHVMNSTGLHEVPGMCGVVDGGIVSGLWGYEAGQSGVGDIFGWFVKHGVPPEYHAAAAERGLDIHEYLTELAARQAIGEHGLVALDWHSGNRSVLVDHELSGLVVGQTLATRAEDTYRALLEATAFGTRTIIAAFVDAGVPVTELVVAGGLLKNPLLMQIYADVTNLPLSTIVSDQGPALGSAIHAAVAAGAYADVHAAAEVMGRSRRGVYQPIPANVEAYDALFAEYTLLHDYFGRGANEVMHRLRAMRRAATSRAGAASARRADDAGDAARRRHHRRSRGGVGMTATADVRETIASLRAEVADLHRELTRYELVIWTAGNVSARVPGRDLMVIKPSGVSYDALTPDAMVVTDLHGELVDGEHSPSSDTAAHAYVYRHLPDVGGVVHTHSTYATAWAAPRRADPVRPHHDRRRVRRGGARRAVRPHRRRLHRPGHRRHAEGQPQQGRPHGRPRPVHHRQGRPLGGQDRGDARGRGTDGAHRPPARSTRPLGPERHRQPVPPLPERLRPVSARRSNP